MSNDPKKEMMDLRIRGIRELLSHQNEKEIVRILLGLNESQMSRLSSLGHVTPLIGQVTAKFLTGTLTMQAIEKLELKTKGLLEKVSFLLKEGRDSLHEDMSDD